MEPRFPRTNKGLVVFRTAVLSGLCWFLLALTPVSCSNKESGATTSSQTTSQTNLTTLTEFQRIAFWNGILTQYPDLPQRVQEIVDGKGKLQQKYTDIPTSKVTVYSYLGAVTFDARTVNLIITDCDVPALAKLLAFWKTIPERARQLGILASSSKSGTPRAVVIGSDARIDFRGPGGTDHQTIDVYHESLTGAARISVHTFRAEGDRAFASMLDYYGRANQVRGPPDGSGAEKKFERVPEDIVTVLVIGKLKNLNIEGGAQASNQSISFETYVNSYSEGEPTKEATEFVKAGETAFRDATVAAEQIRQAQAERTAQENSRQAETARQSENYSRSSEGYSRPPGGGTYRPSGGRPAGGRPGR